MIASEKHRNLRLKLHPLAPISLFLAFFIMIWPIEADILVSALHAQRLILAIIISIVSFVIVFIPFFLAFRSLRLHPQKWRGFGYLTITGVILALNIIFVSLTLYSAITKRKPNKTVHRTIHRAALSGEPKLG